MIKIGQEPTITITPLSSPTPDLLGDINLDGKVDARDAFDWFPLYRSNAWIRIYAPGPDHDGRLTMNDFGFIVRDWSFGRF